MKKTKTKNKQQWDSNQCNLHFLNIQEMETGQEEIEWARKILHT